MGGGRFLKFAGWCCQLGISFFFQGSCLSPVCYLSSRCHAAEFIVVCVAFQSGFIDLQASVLLRLLNLVKNSLYLIVASFIEVLSFILSYFFII